MKEMAPLVYVIDDDQAVRLALDSLLRSVGYDVMCFSSTQDFIREERPDASSCLVLDVRMPGQSGLEFHNTLSQAGIRIPVIFITGHGDVPMSVGAMKAGAVDFLSKPFREQDLLDAIGAAIRKDAERRDEARTLRALSAKFAEMSPKERQVLRGVVFGLSNKQIAEGMGVSEITVKVHRANVMRKSGAASLPDLVRMVDQYKALTGDRATDTT